MKNPRVFQSKEDVGSEGRHRLDLRKGLISWWSTNCAPDIFEYTVDRQLFSPATRVIFPAAPHDKICLKLWILCENDVYNLPDEAAGTKYLLEGLAFNRRFAPDVYLGIAPVFRREEQRIYCGPIIEYPALHQLEMGRPYALIMKRLPENWRLDHQLRNLGVYGGVNFLAASIANIHNQLPSSLGAAEALKYTAEKLSLNRHLFERALGVLSQRKSNMEPYKPISDLMGGAYRQLTKLFARRASEGYVKHCHGDLKATNLWIQPASSSYMGLKKTAPQLLPLDCVDFDPRFCNIDTLSDVAMLAVDLEMRLVGSWTDTVKHRERTQLKNFLRAYLEQAQEQDREEVWCLLEYYMTEKAMICAYMSILYDDLPTLGRRYLEVARSHAHNLAERLHLPVSLKRKTVPLAAHSR